VSAAQALGILMSINKSACTIARAQHKFEERKFREGGTHERTIYSTIQQLFPNKDIALMPEGKQKHRS
jgi:hypothetical protein